MDLLVNNLKLNYGTYDLKEKIFPAVAKKTEKYFEVVFLSKRVSLESNSISPSLADSNSEN